MTISSSKTKPETLNLFEDKLALIDKIRGETFVLMCAFLKNRNIEYGNILQFVRSPSIYPGDPNGPIKIFETNLNKILFKRKGEIRENGLALNFVYKSILKQITKKRGR